MCRLISPQWLLAVWMCSGLAVRAPQLSAADAGLAKSSDDEEAALGVFTWQAPTPYPVARVKLTLNLASGFGYEEIDAVRLVGTTP